MNANKKGFYFMGLAFLPLIACCFDAIIFLEMAFYKTEGNLTLRQTNTHLIIICLLWAASVFLIIRLARKNGFDMLANNAKLTPKRFLVLAAIVLTGILYMSSTWDFKLKPLVEFSNMTKLYGEMGWSVFLLQYMYYLLESALVVLILALGQKAGELLFFHTKLERIPWGGLFCILTWGMLHGLTKDFETAMLTILLSILFEAAYLISGKNLYYAYPAIAIIFLI